MTSGEISFGNQSHGSTNPGAGASLLASDATGGLTLAKLGVGASPNRSDYHFDVDGLARAEELTFRPRAHTAMVTFVFDDANLTDYTLGLPLFQAQGEVACSMVISSALGQSGYMTAAQLQEVAAAGWEIHSHGVSHQDMTEMTEAEIEAELADSKAALEALGLTVNFFAPPFGTFTEKLLRLAPKYYRATRTAAGGLNYWPLNTHQLLSYACDDHTLLSTYQGYVDAAVAAGAWLIFHLHDIDANDVATLNSLIDYIQAADVPIVTFATALNTAGNALDFVGNANLNGYLEVGHNYVDQEQAPALKGNQVPAPLQDGSTNIGTSEAFDSTWEAVKFTATGNHRVRSFSVRLKTSATLTNPTTGINGYLYSDNAGVPGSSLSGGASYLRYGTLTTSMVEYHFAISATLVEGTSYWLVVRQASAPAGGTVSLDRGTTGTALHAYSANGTAWTTEDSKTLWFKLWGRTGYGVQGVSWQNYGLYGYSINSYGAYLYSRKNYGLYAYSDNSIGIYGSSNYQTGIYGVSVKSYGVQAASTDGYGLYSLSTNGGAAYLDTNPTSTNSIVDVLTMARRTSGTPAAGIGNGILFRVEDTVGDTEIAGRVASLLTDPASATLTSALSFWTRNAGAVMAERARIDGPGNLLLGVTAGGANAEKTLALSNAAVDPTASADLCHLYAKDISPGNAALAIYQEAAVLAAVGEASTHKVPVVVNGTLLYLLARTS